MSYCNEHWTGQINEGNEAQDTGYNTLQPLDFVCRAYYKGNGNDMAAIATCHCNIAVQMTNTNNVYFA